MARRSTQILAVGVVMFVVGVVLVLWLLSREETAPAPAPSPTATSSPTPPVAASPVPESQRVPRPLVIPVGHRALAVEVPFAPGVMGLPVPGDRVDIYAVISEGQPSVLLPPNPGTTDVAPLVRLLAANVEVLAVAGPTPEQAGGNPVLLLAVTPDQAERIVFAAAFERLWFSLVPPEEPPAATGGRNYANVLE